MATHDHIRNPVEWGSDGLVEAVRDVGRAAHALRIPESAARERPAIRAIGYADLRAALEEGYRDLASYRTDAVFLAAVYPLAGLVLGWAAIYHDLLPLVFPLASGFALIGPVAGLGLYALSRRHEAEVGGGREVAHPGPAIGSIAVLGLVMLAIFAAWIAIAYGLYHATLGPEAPASAAAFLSDVFTTAAGWTMIVTGCAIGFVFAAVALAIGVISFPLMLDRNVGPITAALTSLRATIANPGPVATWGLIVAAGLVLGSLPALIGLVIVMPVLGHATWHLYRKLVA